MPGRLQSTRLLGHPSQEAVFTRLHLNRPCLRYAMYIALCLNRYLVIVLFPNPEKYKPARVQGMRTKKMVNSASWLAWLAP
ncbi:unnamed protein product [Merluccius merluccius]